MARPIIPIAVRKLSTARSVEVQSMGGTWIPFSMLGQTVRDTVVKAVTAKGYDWGAMPPTFDILLGQQEQEQYDQPQQQPDRQQPVQQEQPQEQNDQPDDGQPDDNDQQQQQQQQNKEARMSMEDIVRKIAGELDDQQGVDFGQKLDDLSASVDQRLAEFKPHDTNTLTPVFHRVEITLPEQQIVKDGLFHHSFDDLVANIMAGIHTFLPGPPGTGKSHAAEQAAGLLGWKFGAISLGPTTPESRLWGGMDAHGRFVETPLLECIRHAMDNPDSGAAFCFDEMDNGHAGILATMNSAQANGWVFAPNGDRLTLGKNMVFIGAANTFGTGPTAEFSGRNKLDAATLDRFAYLPWDTDLGMEDALVRRWLDDVTASQWLDVWRTARKNAASNGLKLFVTMRGAINGAKIIAHGRSIDKALALVLGNKVPADQWSKINPL